MKLVGPLCAIALFVPACVSHSSAKDSEFVKEVLNSRSGGFRGTSETSSHNSRSLETPPMETREDPEPEVQKMTEGALTIENAVRVALLNNRSLRATFQDLGIARGQLVQADLFPNLEIEAQVRFPQEQGRTAQYDFGVGVDLTNIVLRGKRQGIAVAELDAVRLRTAGAALDLGYRVRLAYFEVQAMQQLLDVAKTSMRAFDASFETAKELSRVGNIPDLDLVTDQSSLEGARLQVAEIEVELVDARERLNVLLGYFGEQTTWTIEGRLPDVTGKLPPAEKLETRAIDASLELAETRKVLLASLRRVGLAETAGWLPDLTLGVHAERDGTTWEFGPALSGKLPFFDRQQGNVISRQAEVAALRESYVAESVRLRAAVRAARARLESTEARSKQYRDVLLPLRERVVRETVLQYNAMQVGVFQVLQALRDQLDAGRSYVGTLHEYWRARAAMDQLLAGRLAGTLADPEGVRRSPLFGSKSSERRGH